MINETDELKELFLFGRKYHKEIKEKSTKITNFYSTKSVLWNALKLYDERADMHMWMNISFLEIQKQM